MRSPLHALPTPRNFSRRLMAVLATTATAALLALSVPMLAGAAGEPPPPETTLADTQSGAPQPPVVEPPVVEPPVVEPPVVEPPVVEPPVVEPPVVEPPVVEPPVEGESDGEEQVTDGDGDAQNAARMLPEQSDQLVAAAVGPAVITVRTGGIRDAFGAGNIKTQVDGLPGVSLKLVKQNNGTQVATCLSDANGDCTFQVPADQIGNGSNNDFRIEQTGTAGGYYSNGAFVTGLNNGSFQSTNYRIDIDNVAAGQTYVSGVDFMTAADANSRDASSGVWQNSLNNYPAQQKCGLSIALISDLSSSIDAAALAQLKQAAKGFIDALAGTPSTVALYTFGTTAPAPNTSGSNNATMGGQSTLVPANVTALKSKIDGYQVPGSSYTNWDAGLWQALNGQFDQVIIITDGNPTAYSTGSTTDGVDTRFNELERAIFSANALKVTKRVIAVGVGNVSAANLAAISGPTAGSDYFAGSWSNLATTLKDIATKNCAGSVTVIKKLVAWNGNEANSTPGAGWTFTGAVAAGASIVGAPVRATAGDGAVNYQITVPVAGTTFSATEIQQAGYTLLEQAGGKNAVCTKNGQPATVTDSGALGFSVAVGPNDVVSCTVYNKQAPPSASLIVHKQWVINNVPQPIDTFPAGFAATLTGSAGAWNTAVSIAPGTAATVNETGVVVPSPYCTVDSRIVTKFNESVLTHNLANGAYSTPTLAAGTTNHVTVTNSVTCTSTLTLIKKVINDAGGTAVPADWTLKYGGSSTTSGTVNTVTPGTFTLAETGPAGYQQSKLECSQGLQGSSVTVPYAASVTCTFTNDDVAPTLQLKKLVVGAPDIAASNWTLTAKDGDTVVVTGAGETAVTAVKANTAYDLAETAAQYGGDFTASEWVCVDGAGATVPVVGGTLAKLALDQDVVCSITNTAKPVDPTITKTVTSFSQNADGTWNIVYSVVVTNPGKFAALTYDLADTLAYGAGIQVQSASATGPSGAIAGWNGAGSTTLADDVALPKDSAHTYTITVKANVPSTVPDSATECPTGSGDGGFLNTATLTVDGKQYTAQDCEQPVHPGLDKAPGTAVANPDGTWTVTYTLTATNPHPVALYYDLTDDPAATFPAGVTIVSGQVTDLGYAGSWNPAAVGKNITIADDAVLPAGTEQEPGEHTYTISIVVSFADSVTPGQLHCDTGGLDNTGALLSGGRTDTDDACVSIVRPTVALTKSVTSLVQNTDGTWTIVYAVSVKAAGAGVVTYDLSDKPLFGEGITIDSASATGPAQSAAWNGDSQQVLANDEPIAGGETDVYTITVTADVAEGVVGTAAADCTLETGEKGTGFLNSATVTAAGDSDTQKACDSPVGPSIDKQWVSTQQNPDASWTVTFAVDVANASTTTGLVYSLSDVPQFLDGVTVTGRTVALNGAAPTAWDGSSALATDRPLAADTTDRYVLTFVITVPLGIDDQACTEAPGHGFFNGATVTSGNDSSSSDDCGPVEEGVLPLIEKTVKDGYPRQLPGGDWEIRYDVTVSTPDGNTLHAVYDLSDTLAFGGGIDVTSAGIAGPGSVDVNPNWNGESDTEVAADVVLAADATHVYTVTVIARLDQGVVHTDAADCTLEPGEDGTGFLNTTRLVSGELDRTAEACESPAAPLIEKEVVGGPTQAPDKKVTITYEVTVTNPSELELDYDLDDELGFALWVTIHSATVTSTDATVNPGWNGDTETRVVTGQSIDAEDTHRYTITVIATPTLFVELANLPCVPSEPGHGYFNSALLTSGEDSYVDDACAPIPPSELPTLPFDPPTLALTGGLLGTGALFGALLLLIAGGVLVVLRARRAQAD